MLKNLKALREEYGISQQRLAEAIFVTQPSINKYGDYSVPPMRTPSVWPIGQPAPSKREPIRRICSPKASLLEGGGPRSGSEGVRD